MLSKLAIFHLYLTPFNLKTHTFTFFNCGNKFDKSAKISTIKTEKNLNYYPSIIVTLR